jgi:thiamine biosynthesis lipoprotein
VASVQLITGQTMGTTYAVKLVPNETMPDLSEISAEVQAELDRVNRQMSTYDPTSELSRFNALSSTDWFEVSPETAEVAKLAQQVFEQSDGAFDVTVGPLVNLWGFGPDGRPEEVPSQAQIDALLESTGSTRLEVRLEPPALRKLHPKLQLDFSAIAKGHGVGGEIRTRGVRLDGSPWQVGIERPIENVREIQQVIGLSNQSLATSGNYRNVYELDGQRFSHTINPTTGRPVEDAIASASAIADNCALADAIATCMMSSGFTRGLEIAEQNHWAVLLVRKTAEDGFETAASGAFDSMFSARKIARENAADEIAEMELRP